jgi:hypothetical protein
VHRLRFSVALVILAIGAALTVVPTLPSAGANGPVKARLLTVTELPAGWSVLKASAQSAGLTNNKCLGGLIKTAKHLSTASAAFEDHSLAPILAELLATGHGAVAKYEVAKKDLAACRSLSMKAEGVKLSGRLTPLTFPTVGTASVAYSAALTYSQLPVGLDLVLFRSGTYLGFVAYATLGTPSVATVQAFANEAVSKAEGNPVSPPVVTTTSSTTTTAGL